MNLDNAPATDHSQETSTELATIQIPDIIVPGYGKPLLERRMRLRRLNVVPGGTVGVHSHENRPAILFTLKGSATFYSSNRDEPFVLNEGEAFAEYNDVRHYAVNNSKTEMLQFLTFDLLDDEDNNKRNNLHPDGDGGC